MIPTKQQLEIIKQGTVDLINEDLLEAKLNKGKPLCVKLGLDPTAPDIHLGHAVVLHKLKQFQELGHKVVLIVGDFTAQVGDPSGRSELRPQLSEKEIKKNAKTYTDQAFKILDKKKTDVRFNSEWLGKMSVLEFMRLGSKQTVARMLERDDFKQRFKSEVDISILEFYYPLMQAQDSVEIKADVEIGGSDQLFNLLMGRTIQKRSDQEQQVILTMPLLVGTDGVQKMSKSYGNYIGVSDKPGDIFGKVMSISDDLMWSYYELLSKLNNEELAGLRAEVVAGTLHPKKVKQDLAFELTARFYDEKQAAKVQAEFEKVFAKKGKPTDMQLVKADSKTPLFKIAVEHKLVKSGGEFRRLVTQGGVKLDDKKVTDANSTVTAGEHVLQIGKRTFASLAVS